MWAVGSYISLLVWNRGHWTIGWKALGIQLVQMTSGLLCTGFYFMHLVNHFQMILSFFALFSRSVLYKRITVSHLSVLHLVSNPGHLEGCHWVHYTPKLLFSWIRACLFSSYKGIAIRHPVTFDSVSKSFRTESITKSTTTTNIRWEATQRVMVAKLTKLTHKITIQLHLVAENCTVCLSRSRRPVRKLMDTPSYVAVQTRNRRFILLISHKISSEELG
jgi:hypothetical protein